MMGLLQSLLANLDTLLLYLFAFCALVGGLLMIVLRQPMRVALALISTMVFLGGIYGLLGVHFIAAFQVLIYVGAVMVFMVYVIMLLDTRDSAFMRQFSRMLVPGALACALFLAALGFGLNEGLETFAAGGLAPSEAFGLHEFAVAFLNEYWLHFELTSLLLVAAVIAAMAIIKVNRKDDRG